MNTTNNTQDELQLTIESEAFDELRADFNNAVQRSIQSMVKKEVNEATITVKVNLALQDYQAPAQAGGEIYVAKLPQFAYEITRALQIKSKTTGKYDNADYELTADGDGFVLRRTKFGQMNINDVMGGGVPEPMEADIEPVEEQPAIDGGQQKMLNYPDSEEPNGKGPWWQDI